MSLSLRSHASRKSPTYESPLPEVLLKTYYRLGPRKVAAALAHCLDKAQLSRLSSPKLSAAGRDAESYRTHSRKASRDAQAGLDPKMRPDTPQRITLAREDSTGKYDNEVRKDGSVVLCVDDNPLNLRVGNSDHPTGLY